METPLSILNKFECQICLEIALIPAKCSNCNKIWCADCLLESQKFKGRICPNRCNDIEIVELSNSEKLNHSQLKIKCVCCNEILKLRSYFEHQELLQHPFYCYNFKRCQKIAKLKLEKHPQHFGFCSFNCAFFYEFTLKKKEEDVQVLYLEFKEKQKEIERVFKANLKVSFIQKWQFDENLVPSKFVKISDNDKVSFSLSSNSKQIVFLKNTFEKRSYFILFKLQNHKQFIKMGLYHKHNKIKSTQICTNGTFSLSTSEIIVQSWKGIELTENCVKFSIVIDFCKMILYPFDFENNEFEWNKKVIGINWDCKDCIFGLEVQGNNEIQVGSNHLNLTVPQNTIF